MTDGRLVVDICPLKDEKFRVRLTVGGDASSVTASLATVKILLNSVVSTTGATFPTINIKGIFLRNSPP